MDLRTFIATMTGHVIWPVTALAILFVVMVRLPKLARFIKSIRFKDVEVVIKDELTDARPEADRLAIERGETYAEALSTDKILQLVEMGPAVAIMAAWQRLEQSLIKLIQHNGLMRFTTPAAFVEQLVDIGELNEGDLRLFRKLRLIRNAAVHAHEGDEPSKAEALEFNTFVNLLIDKVDAVKQRPDSPQVE